MMPSDLPVTNSLILYCILYLIKQRPYPKAEINPLIVTYAEKIRFTSLFALEFEFLFPDCRSRKV